MVAFTRTILRINISCADQEGGGGAGGLNSPENHKNIGFLAILVRIPEKTTT